MVSFRSDLAAAVGPFLIVAFATSSLADLAPYLEAQVGLKTWTADFVQTRTLKSLKQPLKTPGHLYFSAPNAFRWELGDPVQTIAVRQSNEVVIFYPQLKRAERYELTPGERSPWQEMLSLLEAGFPRSQQELESRFRIVSDAEAQGKTKVVLQPRAASARRWVQEMELIFDPENKSLAATELRFGDGSSLRNDFTNEKKNPTIAPELFQPRVPLDYKLLEPGKGRRP